ncbi:TPA: hypothetical protein MG561_25550 [Klebsiella pneumoniae]|nr:hypothetical protein [Klebsiella pneumoniae]
MGSCAAPSAKGDDKFITTDYLQQCPIYVCRLRCRMKHCAGPSPRYNRCGKALLNRRKIHVCEK